ncbi:hypothetical protein BBJ28_00010749 [Nothophytophthora sp. Chile5]|nr:hypothetical protein BBJ28_00010749 [Nothophytophthora sp. Chile5]
MLPTGVRRAATSKRALALVQSQRRNSGSLSKNKHVENWNNWRGDSEKRFKFDANFFTSVAAWGVVPFTLYYVVGSAERLGGKRKLQQLDGSVEDAGSEESDADDSGGGEERRDDAEGGEEKEESYEEDGSHITAKRSVSTEPTSTLVSATDLMPVSQLFGSQFPLQLAAEYSTFGYRGKRRGYSGELHAIVLTWPRRLYANETTLPGALLWCYGDSTQGTSDKSGLAEVLSLGDTLAELKMKLANGTTTIVPMTRVRRLTEFLIRKGAIHLQSEQ